MFVRAALGLVAIGTTMVATAVATERPSACALMRRFEKRLAIHVSTTDDTLGRRSAVRYTPANEEVVRAFLPLIENELARYPRAALVRAHVERVVVARSLTVEGRAAGGSAFPELGTVAFGVGYPGPETKAWNRRAVHHEVFHMLDATFTSTWPTSRAWDQLNFEGFFYVGYESYPAVPEPGFLSGYSMSQGYEDRAELFSFLMDDPPLVARRAADDPVLRGKVAYLVRLLHERAPELDSVLPGLQ